jgi:hypothetical protein
METLSLISIAIIALTTVFLYAFHWKPMKEFYGKYAVLVTIVSILFSGLMYYFLHYYMEWYIFNFVSNIAAVIISFVGLYFYRKLILPNL